MYDLKRLSSTEVLDIGSALRDIGSQATSFEEAAQKISDFLYTQLTDAQTGRPTCALVRVYKTVTYAEINTDLRKIADQALGETRASQDMKCLVLFGTTGVHSRWNARTHSVNHQVIPLPSEAVVTQLPMIAQLIRQFGLTLGAVVRPDPRLLTDDENKRYGIFYVEQAHNSPYIPAQQEFVVAYGIQSVLGFGGLFASGDLYAIVLFSKEPIPPATAALFKTLPIEAKLALSTFKKDNTFT